VLTVGEPVSSEAVLLGLVLSDGVSLVCVSLGAVLSGTVGLGLAAPGEPGSLDGPGPPVGDRSGGIGPPESEGRVWKQPHLASGARTWARAAVSLTALIECSTRLRAAPTGSRPSIRCRVDNCAGAQLMRIWSGSAERWSDAWSARMRVPSRMSESAESRVLSI